MNLRKTLLRNLTLIVTCFFIITCKLNCELKQDPFPRIETDSCGQIDPKLLAAYLLLQGTQKVKIIAPDDKGDLTIRINGKDVLGVKAGQTSKSFSIPIEITSYEIKSFQLGTLFYNDKFNFNETITDGIIIREKAKIEKNSCNILNGKTGKLEVQDCGFPANF